MQDGSGVLAQGPAEAAPRPWRDLGVRAASAAILAPLGFAALWWGGLWLYLAATTMTVVASSEWAAMMRVDKTKRRPFILTALVGAIYILPATPLLLWLSDDPVAGRANIIFIVLIVWCSDIGAYLIGRLVGGPKLAPSISPGKTRSGAAGGLIAAMLVGWVAAALWGVPPLQGILIAGVLGMVSQLGDLFESAAKRHFGVKDSGHIIPGHGGVLDRIDGLLTAVPAAALLVLILGQGKVLWQ